MPRWTAILFALVLAVRAAPAAAEEPPAELAETAVTATRAAPALVDPAGAESVFEEERRLASGARDERGFGAQSPSDMGAMFLHMLLVLGSVCLLAYILLGKVLPRLMKIEPPTAPRRLLQVVDRLPVDQRRSIMVVRMGTQYYLVGSSEQGLGLLSKLDPGEVDAALKAAHASSPRLGGLAGLLPRRQEK